MITVTWSAAIHIITKTPVLRLWARDRERERERRESLVKRPFQQTDLTRNNM